MSSCSLSCYIPNVYLAALSPLGYFSIAFGRKISSPISQTQSSSAGASMLKIVAWMCQHALAVRIQACMTPWVWAQHPRCYFWPGNLTWVIMRRSTCDKSYPPSCSVVFPVSGEIQMPPSCLAECTQPPTASSTWFYWWCTSTHVLVHIIKFILHTDGKK